HTLRFVCDHAATPARHTLSLHDALPILPGTTFSGSTIVTLTVTDASGNSSDTSFNVNVIDTTDPTIDAIADQTVNGDAACMGIVGDNTSLAVVADNCDTAPTVTQSPVPGTTFSGTTIVTLTVRSDERHVLQT